MDAIDALSAALSLVPVPYLHFAFNTLKIISTAVQQVRASKEQLKGLASAIAQLLRILNNEYQAGRLLEGGTRRALLDLKDLLNEISAFTQRQTTSGLLRSLYTKNDRIVKIDTYYRRLSVAVDAFQIVSLVNMQEWQRSNESARISDQQALHHKLQDLERNQNRLFEALNANHSNMFAMMVSIHGRLARQSVESDEAQFLEASLRYMTTASGRRVQHQHWMITSFDVEFDEMIGSGGCGQIWKGKWYGAEVALKVFKTDGVNTRSTLIGREIEVWSKLAHPHVLQFMGANILDDNPFIVMPYLPKGNVRDYIQQHPRCDRVRILHDISLGLVYLHSRNVIHGDLKAMNILIGDDDKALLCDFGLSNFVVDMTTSLANQNDGEAVYGSQFWMSPERLLGVPPEQPSDIYAFGMIIIEIYTNETPLSHIGYFDFFEYVVTQGVRPQRPAPNENSAMPDEIWDLAQRCWVAELDNRPHAEDVRDCVNHTFQLASVHTSQQSRHGSSIRQVENRRVPEGENDWRQLEQNTGELQQIRQHYLLAVQRIETLTKLIDEQTTQLSIVKKLLKQETTIPGTDVIQIVNRLNDEIFQCAAHLAETLPDIRAFDPEPTSVRSEEACSHVWELGHAVWEVLKAARNARYPSTPVQFGFQACLVQYCAFIISSWPRESQYEEVFPQIQDDWRQADLNTDLLTGVTDFLLSKMLAVLAVAGHYNIPTTFTTDSKRNLQWIAKSVLQLRDVLGGKLWWNDSEVLCVPGVFCIPGGATFDAKFMDDSNTCKWTRLDLNTSELVLCPTDLGLKCSRRGQGLRMEYEETILLKPRVLLQSSVEDILLPN